MKASIDSSRLKKAPQSGENVNHNEAFVVTSDEQPKTLDAPTRKTLLNSKQEEEEVRKLSQQEYNKYLREENERLEINRTANKTKKKNPELIQYQKGILSIKKLVSEMNTNQKSIIEGGVNLQFLDEKCTHYLDYLENISLKIKGAKGYVSSLIRALAAKKSLEGVDSEVMDGPNTSSKECNRVKHFLMKHLICMITTLS